MSGVYHSTRYGRHAHHDDQHNEHQGAYRCVIVFTYPTRPRVVAAESTSRENALHQWNLLISLGGYEAHGHRRALVMTDADYRKLPGATA